MNQDNEMREFLLVLRRALLMIVNWIEAKHRLGAERAEPTYCDGCQKRINRGKETPSGGRSV